MPQSKSEKKAKPRGKSGKSGTKHRRALVRILDVPFGGFYYDDETLMAEKVHVEIVSQSPNKPPRTISKTLDVVGGSAEWHPPRVKDLIRVWFSAVNGANVPIATAAACEHWPSIGGYIERADGQTFIPIGGTEAISDIECLTQEPLRLPPSIESVIKAARDHVMDRVPFGRFYYDDDTGAADEVEMTAVTGDGEDHARMKTVEGGHAEYYDDGDNHYDDVIEVRFQPYSLGQPLGPESRPKRGQYIEEAGGRTTGPLIRNRIVHLRLS